MFPKMTKKSSNRLYVAGPLEPGKDLRLDGERSHYVARVLRLRAGEVITLFDGNGGEYAAVVGEVSRKNVIVRTGEHRERDVESPLAIHLAQGISRGERMDTVVQKATELGVHRIAPVITERSVVQLDAARAEKRVQHWSGIAQSACEQCGRNLLPHIEAPQSLKSWLEREAPKDALRILLHPGAGTTLPSLQPSPGRIQLLIGPEGGLNDEEHEHALAAGFTPCSLGPRILRTETAAIAAIAVLQARWGDLG
jgi:16S rRNA (uracil1498-N3)-methyltransferase